MSRDRALASLKAPSRLHDDEKGPYLVERDGSPGAPAPESFFARATDVCAVLAHSRLATLWLAAVMLIRLFGESSVGRPSYMAGNVSRVCKEIAMFLELGEASVETKGLMPGPVMFDAAFSRTPSIESALTKIDAWVCSSLHTHARSIRIGTYWEIQMRSRLHIQPSLMLA